MTNVRGYDAGRVAVNDDGTVSVWTSCPAIGQGVGTTFAQIVAEHLGVPFAMVRTELVDTAHSPPGSGSFASRSAISAGGALIAVSGQVRERILDTAADALEADRADIVIDAEGRVGVRGAPAAALTLAEVVAAAEPGHLDIGEPYDPEETAYPYATHACVVEVDAETGAVEILRYVVAEDCGPEINPIVVEGQVHGATAQGIGATLYEAMRFGPDGQAVTGSFMDYLVPTACELPALLGAAPGDPGPRPARRGQGRGRGRDAGAAGGAGQRGLGRAGRGDQRAADRSGAGAAGGVGGLSAWRWGAPRAARRAKLGARRSAPAAARCDAA